MMVPLVYWLTPSIFAAAERGDIFTAGSILAMYAMMALVLREFRNRWNHAERYRFLEEGLTISDRGKLEYLPWKSVTAAKLGHGEDIDWTEIVLTFDRSRRVGIPLTPFVERAAIGAAIRAPAGRGRRILEAPLRGTA